jgi:hypothetical protein
MKEEKIIQIEIAINCCFTAFVSFVSKKRNHAGERMGFFTALKGRNILK